MYVCGMELFDRIQEATGYLREVGFESSTIGIVLGTGLGSLMKQVVIEHEVSYDSIPHFPTSTVEFHKGRLVQGILSGKKILFMEGRMHHYEGYDMEKVGFPIRVLRSLGVQTLLMSGAAGSMELTWQKGDLMMINDHINLQPSNPLIGQNDDRLGVRFLDMSEPYSNRLQKIARDHASRSGVKLREGVYVSVPGPMLESPAEYRYLNRIGADAVGMSTVPEVIVARHSGMECLAAIVLTDECDPDDLKPIDISEILEVASKAEIELIRLFQSIIPEL